MTTSRPPMVEQIPRAAAGMDAAAALSSGANSTTTNGNWTEFSCTWLDEIYNIQNNFYWQHTSSREILMLYGFVCTMGALANLFVVVSFVKTSHLRNLRNYFIVNLALSDLMLCTVTAPVTLYLTLNLFWPFGGFACQIVASIQAVNLFVSCMTLVLIAMDRFLLTLCPVKWRLAAKAPVVCYLVVWLMSLLIATPYFFAVSTEPVTMFNPWNYAHADQMLQICDRKRPEICLEKTWHRLPFSRRTYTLTVLAIQYILPLAALGVAYSQIGSTIRKRVKHTTTIDHERKQLLTKRNRKALLLLLMLVIIYGIAWLPMNAYNVLNVLDVIEFSQYRYIFCHLIGMSSACINPILYALINDSFRSAFLAMLRPLFGPCTKYIAVDAGHSPIHHVQHTHSTVSTSAHNIAANQNCEPTREALVKKGASLSANGSWQTTTTSRTPMYRVGSHVMSSASEQKQQEKQEQNNESGSQQQLVELQSYGNNCAVADSLKKNEKNGSCLTEKLLPYSLDKVD